MKSFDILVKGGEFYIRKNPDTKFMRTDGGHVAVFQHFDKSVDATHFVVDAQDTDLPIVFDLDTLTTMMDKDMFDTLINDITTSCVQGYVNTLDAMRKYPVVKDILLAELDNVSAGVVLLTYHDYSKSSISVMSEDRAWSIALKPCVHSGRLCVVLQDSADPLKWELVPISTLFRQVITMDAEDNTKYTAKRLYTVMTESGTVL